MAVRKRRSAPVEKYTSKLKSSHGNKDNARQTQSKKRSRQRAQNAFKLNASDEEAGSEVEVNSEDDEEIDSDEAFESGDEDKFDAFKFSGSEYLKKQNADSHSKKQRQAHQPPKTSRNIEVNLDEESEDYTNNLSNSAGRHERPSDSESQSDFEEDEGEDLMDLSEMLGATKPAASASTNTEESSAKSDGSHEDSDTSTSSVTSDSEYSSGEEEEEDAATSRALEGLVKQIQQKRKRDDDTQVPSPAKRPHSMIENNEQGPESEHNLSLSSAAGKLNLQSMLNSLDGSQGKLLRKTQTLAAPLAKPIQDRLNRSAAYDTVKEQITKWQPAVRQMREAEVLKFPLNEPTPALPNNNSLASTFKPSNELEHQISNILKESGMQSEKSVAKFEDLEMAKLSVEEVKKRRAELALMRDLLFRQEQKAKRQSKIKSKSYRRVHRKEKEKARLALEQDNPVDSAESKHELESRRARERMELRHKNTGKWAQKMLARANHGEGSRAAITEQLQRGEELERKIRGEDDDDFSEVSNEDSLRENDVLDEPLPDKGVFGMKFMRDADARESEMLNGNNNDDDYEADTDKDNTEDNAGRRSFKPVPAAAVSSRAPKTGAKNQLAQQRSSVTNPDQVPKMRKKEVAADESLEVVNPWLSSTGSSRKNRDAMISKDTDEGLKFAAKLKKKKSAPMHQGRIKVPVLDVNKVLPMKMHAADSDHEDAEGIISNGNGKSQIALKQLDLVSQAFAGDNVVAEFAAAKESEAAEDAPQDIDETLPGWGSWVGNGIKKSRNAKKFIKHVDGIKLDERKDSKLQHVIINEKRMKQARPYMSQSVPYPFENKEQYERSLSLPIGPEFTTRTNFQRQIMPHVVKKQGKVVAPMEKPFKD